MVGILYYLVYALQFEEGMQDILVVQLETSIYTGLLGQEEFD
jgi:hypothetical protein